MPSLKFALKEWSAAIDALVQGQSNLLLRKGGIREQGGKFQVPHSQVLLYPTLEHQKLDQLKPKYRKQIQPETSGGTTQTISIKAWATIDHIFQISQTQQIQDLAPFHIWTEQFVAERLQWKKQQPLHVLLLRTYRLERPKTLTWQTSYGGCRSWIEINAPIEAPQTHPALDDQTYQNQRKIILSVLKTD